MHYSPQRIHQAIPPEGHGTILHPERVPDHHKAGFLATPNISDHISVFGRLSP
jgi:hypothetical protein